MLNRRSGFTLIELLIVVAIIAILAAIAVPNFLEAQVRSKVSRTLADMRTIRTGLESYYVDNNRYPETDQGIAALATGKRSILRLTTPISYLTSIPASPWKENYGSASSSDPKVASTVKSYLYVRRFLNDPSTNDPNYNSDRLYYIAQGALTPGAVAVSRSGEWLMKSVGPDNLDDRDAGISAQRAGWSADKARVYDPTNGTVSYGDIVVFSDRSGTGKN
ncbi:prepilin-type N-terminal cleavage/methylation domain-containing protein [bacterium]|nr:prepilin-type N-terminal cleavage/methylation domain-containing protein [bacterium]